jgi:hypothetical protein
MRSAHLLDENSSKDMTLVMSRLKELREWGHTIVGILHAPKGDARTYRGSSALIDQCDHALGFEKVKKVKQKVRDMGGDRTPSTPSTRREAADAASGASTATASRA